ncbi:MAG: hypothetical protein HZA50_05835 [Planctomycetes bacterium]|nr:hypothetical protein [Planctomycetota bacterium]
MLKQWLTGLAILMICQLSLAGPPDKALIPDAASWVAHLDVEAMMATKTFKALAGMAGFAMQPPAMDENGKNASSSPLDPIMGMLKDLKAVTFYGLTGGEAQPVVIVRGKLDKSTIMAMIGLADDKPAEMYGNRKIFLSSNKDRPSESFYICFYDDNTMIGCQNVASLRSAMDLADGSGKPLAKDNVLSEMLTFDKGMVAIIAAKDIDGYARLIRKESPEAAAVLAKIKNICLRIGEKGESICASASVFATAQEHAANIEQVLKGLVAMGELASDGDKGLALIMKLLKPTISREGTRVDVEVKASLTEIILVLMSGQIKIGGESPATSANQHGDALFKWEWKFETTSTSRPAVKAEK